MRRLRSILLSAIALAFLVGTATAQGQEKETKKKPLVDPKRDTQVQFYRHSLGVDSVKAGQVSRIQSEYKSGLSVLMKDTSLTDQGRRAKVMELMEAKNIKLRKILSPAQQEKIIPTTERSVRPEFQGWRRSIDPRP